MSKRSKTTLIISSLVAGLLLTFASIFYNHVTQKLQCPNAPPDANVVCQPQINNHGFPLAYLVTDVPGDDFRAGGFAADFIVWSVVSLVLIYAVKKVKA